MTRFPVGEDARMLKEFRTAIGLLLLVSVITGLAYPLLVTGIAQLAFPEQANGSLIRDTEGQVRGSWLLAQPFDGDQWFQPRPSAGNFATVPSAASNFSASNPALVAQVRQSLHTQYRDHSLPVPLALVTTSGSGLDPHLPVAAAQYQVARIAKARQLPTETLEQLIRHHTEQPLIGPAVVNVLALNLALVKNPPLPSTSQPSVAP